MPTFWQMHELKENTVIEVVKSYNDVENLDGMILISKINNNQIFFPFNGYVTDFKQGIQKNNTGCYWTSSLGINSITAYCLKMYQKSDFYNMTSNSIGLYSEQRFIGLGIRPVYMN